MKTNNMKQIINILTKNNETISVMESCTGGGVTNAITNIEGASNVLKFSAVTYSNEFKIKMGVDSHVIEKYSVYSKETAMEMSRNISIFANSNYGIGVTGKLNRTDKFNLSGKDNQVFISIYDKDNDKYYNFDLYATKINRKENKKLIVTKIIKKLLAII